MSVLESRVINGKHVSVFCVQGNQWFIRECARPSVINCVSVSLLGYVVLLISGLLMLDHPMHPEVACNDVASKWKIVCRLQ